MPIFSLETLGQTPSLPTGSTVGDGDDGFAETLAAAFAASASTAVMPNRPVESGLAAGRLGVRGMGDSGPASGTADLQRNMVSGSSAPEAVADAMSAEPSMAVAKAPQTADVVPVGLMQRVERQADQTAAKGGSPDLDGSLRSSTAIAMFDRLGTADGSNGDRAPAAAVTGIAATGPQQAAGPVWSVSHDDGQSLDGPHSLHRDQPAIASSARDGLPTLGGSADADYPMTGEKIRPAEMRPPVVAGRLAGEATNQTSAAPMTATLSQPVLGGTTPAALAPTPRQHDQAGTAPAQIATSIIGEAIAQPASRTATSAPLRASFDGGVDHRDVDIQRDPELPPAGKKALDPTHSSLTAAVRQTAADASAPSTFNARVKDTDRPEPFRPADAGPRGGGGLGSPVAAYGNDGQPAHIATSAGPAIQPPAIDAAVRPQGDVLGFERLQPALSTESAAFDVERFEPATALASSRTLAPAAGGAPAAQVALQIARALPGGVDRLSVHLQPAELGSVDIQLTFESQGRVSALIIAERPETLELLQRDGRLLERSLGDSGLKLASDGLSFALRQDQQQQQGQGFHEQAQARQAAFRAGRAYDDASDAEQRPPALQVDRLRLLDIHT
ncbi:MAG: flagellar hook-length control protein FliK [Geminicoccaceae bacterium]